MSLRHTRRTSMLLKTMASAAALAALVTSMGCRLEAGPDYPGGGYDGYPSDEYIATTEPVYYDGNATYWYGGFWYYRGEGGRWNHYGREPAGLYQRRMQAPPARRGYEGRPGRGSVGRSGGRR
jgi:hypothetical protein